MPCKCQHWSKVKVAAQCGEKRFPAKAAAQTKSPHKPPQPHPLPSAPPLRSPLPRPLHLPLPTCSSLRRIAKGHMAQCRSREKSRTKRKNPYKVSPTLSLSTPLKLPPFGVGYCVGWLCGVAKDGQTQFATTQLENIFMQSSIALQKKNKRSRKLG